MSAGGDLLVAGERFGVIRNHFRAVGVEAYSCDTAADESGDSRFHIQGNWERIIPSRRWRGIIIHPVCTALSVSGNWVYAKGKPKWGERVASAAYVDMLWELCIANADRVCFENPVGVIPTMTTLGQPSQIIQPWQFGDDASKATGYWLWKLPHLIAHPADRCAGRKVEHPPGSGRIVERWSNQTDSGQNRLTPDRKGEEGKRAMERAKTYPGPTRAMVAQWAPLLGGNS